MGRIVLKDLRIHGEIGVESLKETRSLLVRRKLDVLEYAKRNFDIDEMVLINPFGRFITFSRAMAVIEKIADLKVSIFDETRIVEALELPKSIEILENFDTGDFSSSPINNISVAMLNDEMVEIPIPSIWIEVLEPDCVSPVSRVKEKLDSIRKGDSLIVVLNTYLLKDEYEAIDTLVKESGGFIIDNHDFLIEPRSNLEVEFMKRMRARSGKFLGMKILRGDMS